MSREPARSYSRVLLGRVEKTWWERGATYAREGRVGEVVRDLKGVGAVVRGTKAYHVRVAWYGNGISTHCTCPIGGPKAVCKHVIALAIVADEANGLAPPDEEEVELGAIPPPLVSRTQIQKMYDDPLNANLEVLRMAASESGGWSRPHARLPQAPQLPAGEAALDAAAVERAFREIRRWTRRRSFDPYFCAGEIMAAFCEVLRACRGRWENTPSDVAAEILKTAADFHREMLEGLIDDSDGNHVFGSAHLRALLAPLQDRRDLSPGNQAVADAVAGRLAEYE